MNSNSSELRYPVSPAKGRMFGVGEIPVHIAIVFLALPFLQLGISYYLSVQVFLFALLFIWSLNSISMTSFTIVVIGSSTFLAKAALLLLSSTEFREVLVPIRQMICFAALFFVADLTVKCCPRKSKLFALSFTFMTVLLGLVLIQFVLLKKGIYFGFPIQYFTVNAATLSGAEKALFFGTRFRPTGFYGEPSYVAFVCLGLLAVSVFCATSRFKRNMAFTVAIAVAIVIQALSGIVAIVLFFCVYEASQVRSRIQLQRLGLFSFLVLLGVFLIASTANPISDRISAVLNQEDESTHVRITMPMEILSKAVKKNEMLVGVTPEFIEENVEGASLDNALFGFVLTYGLLGIPALVSLLVFVKHPALICLLLLNTQFNGSIFHYDKMIFLGMVIGVCFVGRTNIDQE